MGGNALSADASNEKIVIVATTAFIGQPLQEIFTEHAEVITLMKEGVDPHLYRPTRAAMHALARADVILWTGASLEANLRRPITALRRANKTTVITLMDFVPEDTILSAQKQKSPDVIVKDSPYVDPHIWMDPLLWRDVIGDAVRVIQQRFPQYAQIYSRRYDQLARGWTELDAMLAKQIDSIAKDQRILVTAHDAFSYFGRRYGITVEAIQGISTESEADLYRIRALIDIIVAQRVPAIFSEASVHPRHIIALIEGVKMRGIDLKQGGVLFSDSMGHPKTPQGRYDGMMRHNVMTIVQALQTPAQKVAKTHVDTSPAPR